MKRGDVYYANLNPAFGSEQGGHRPVLIIQNNTGNKFSGTTIVAPMTSSIKPSLPVHVPVSKEDNLHPNTIILLEQIRTIDKDRLEEFFGSLSERTMEKVDEALRISVALNKEETEKKGEEMDNLQVFSNKELDLKVRTILNEDGSISVNAEDTAVGFGWSRKETKNGKEYTSVRWERMNSFSAECGFAHSWAKDDYIPESLFYRLGMKASNAVADKFQNWLAMEVIPSIRKTGGYQYKKMSAEEMMRVQLGMIDGHEERISKLEDTMNIDYGQQRVLEKEVGKIVIEHLSGKDSPAYKEMGKKVFSECNRDVKDYFHVNSRNNIPRLRFDDAVEYIRGWIPCTNTRVAIQECNAQIGMSI